MKVITLYNKIARGEDIPLKIEYNQHIYQYEEGIPDYFYLTDKNEIVLFGIEVGLRKENLNQQIKVIKGVDKE